MRKYLLAATAALLGLVPLAASAQEAPSYADQPSYGDQGNGDQQIRGRIVAFDGAYAVTVRDDRGYVDNIQLHDGTIINPTGLTLAPGMVVSVLGFNAGSFFSANEVDTPYTYYNDEPYYGGHPWDYYGPSIDLGFFFGSGGWWHESAFGGPWHYDGGARVYQHVDVENFSRNGNGYHNGNGYNSGNGRNYSNNNSSGTQYGRGYTGSTTTTASSTFNGQEGRRYPTERTYTPSTTTRSYTGTEAYAPTRTTYQSSPSHSYQPATRTYSAPSGRGYQSSGGGASHGGGRTNSEGHDRR